MRIMRVLFLDTVHPILQDKLTEYGLECIDGTTLNVQACKDILPTINGIVVRSRFKLDEPLLQFAQKLQFIARSGAGMENIDLNYCKKKKIKLFNAPEGNKTAVAEHALAMLLNLFNNINRADQQIRNGIWNREENRGVELTGKTIGIIGFGNNGSAFAKVLSGFDCKILVYDKYKSNFGTKNIQESSLETIYQDAEIISFHIPQNEETIYFADNVFFQSVRNPFYLINVSRGKIVQTRALVDALQKGKVLGAALDVLEYEQSSFEQIFDGERPKDFQYLIQSDRVILSPHVAGWTQESYFKLSNILAEKIIHFLKTSNKMLNIN